MNEAGVKTPPPSPHRIKPLSPKNRIFKEPQVSDIAKLNLTKSSSSDKENRLVVTERKEYVSKHSSLLKNPILKSCKNPFLPQSNSWRIMQEINVNLSSLVTNRRMMLWEVLKEGRERHTLTLSGFWTKNCNPQQLVLPLQIKKSNFTTQYWGNGESGFVAKTYGLHVHNQQFIEIVNDLVFGSNRYLPLGIPGSKLTRLFWVLVLAKQGVLIEKVPSLEVQKAPEALVTLTKES